MVTKKGSLVPKSVKPISYSRTFVEPLDLRATYEALVGTSPAAGRRPKNKGGLFARSFTQPPQARGVLNNMNFCFMNAVLQALIFTPPFAQLAISAADEKKLCPTLACLGRWLLSYWAGPEASAISPPSLNVAVRSRTNASLSPFFIGQVSGSTQEDASEFMHGLLEVIQTELCALERYYRELSTHTFQNDSSSHTAEVTETKGWTFVKGKERLSLRKECNEQHSVLFYAVFGGTLENHLKGGKKAKDHVSVVVESFLVLQVDMCFGAESRLDAALERTLQTERVHDDVRGNVLHKTVKLRELPMVLLLQLRRWAVTAEGEFVKLSNILRFSKTLLLPKSVCADDKLGDVARSYQLVSFVAHRGTTAERGHYVSYLRTALLTAAATPRTAPQQSDEKLILCNDTHLETVAMRNAVEREAVYFLVYQRKL